MEKKDVNVLNALELLEQLANGKRVEGVLFVDVNTRKLTFKAYNRKRSTYRRKHDKMICRLEHGWVKESEERIKMYESIPKVLGTAKVTSILDREVKVAKDALIDRELDMMEFC